MIQLEIKSNVKVGMEEVLKAAASLETPELEVFFQKIAELVVQRKKPVPPSQEAELLVKINEPALSNEVQAEYTRLYKKLQLETINENEYEQLSQLMQKVEQKGVERLKYLIELSKLKNTTLAELKIQHISPSVNV